MFSWGITTNVRLLAVLTALVMGCAGAGAAMAQRGDPRPFDQASARARLVAPMTKVIVLDPSHLDNAPKVFDPAWLAPVLC